MIAHWLDRTTVAAWLFLAPALLLLGIFVLFPIAYLCYLSLTTGHLGQAGVQWIGFRQYQQIFQNPDFWQVSGNTLYYTIATVIPSVILPIGLAVALDQAIPGRGILRSLYFLPAVISTVAAGLGWRWMFQPDGIVNSLIPGNSAPNWLGNPTLAMPIVILLSIWKQLGFNMVVFLAGLQAIPTQRYEAAEIDGANAWAKFWHITLPGLRPTTIFVVISTTIFAFRSFEQVFVLTGGGPLNSTNILVYYIYEQAFGLFDFGYAAAASIVLLVAVMALVYWQWQTWSDQSG